MYNVKEEELDTLRHAIDLTISHPSDDNEYCYFDVTVHSTVILVDINSSCPINPNDALRTAIEEKEKITLLFSPISNHQDLFSSSYL
jgi:hypothetical protein